MGRDHLRQFPIGGDLGFTRGILMLDQCEGTPAWQKAGTGSDHALAYDAAAAWVGEKGLKVTTRTTTPTAGDFVQCFRHVEHVETGLVVLRYKFSWPTLSQVQKTEVYLAQDDGDDVWQAMIRWVQADGFVTYQDSSSSQSATIITAGSLLNKQWAAIELVIDLKKHQYVSVRMFGTLVDLSGVGMFFSEGGGSAKSMLVELRHYAAGANAAAMHYDYLFLGEFFGL